MTNGMTKLELILAVVVVLLAGLIGYGIVQQRVADAQADQKIKDEREKRDQAETQRKAEHDEAMKRIDALEQRKREPATAQDVATMFAAYMKQGQQPIVIEHKDAATGKPLPDAPPALLFEGKSLTDLRNREYECQQTEINCADLAKEVVRLKGDKTSLESSLAASEKARKHSKWRKVGDAGIKLGIFAAGYAVGKATK